MIVGSGPPPADPVAVTRALFWQHQIPATVMPGPAGGILAYMETGERVNFPTLDAVQWFLTGYRFGSEAEPVEAVPVEAAVAPEPGQGSPTEGEE